MAGLDNIISQILSASEDAAKETLAAARKHAEEILALASNPIGAKPGEFVEVEPASRHNIGISVVVFLLPCLFLAGGYVVGQSLLGLGDLAGTSACPG